MKPRRSGAIGAVVCATWLLGASVSMAGEVNGQGDVVPGGVTGKSACSFSGLEDHPVDPGTVQNWGIIPKVVRDFLTSIGLHPGEACNPTNGDHGE